MKRGVRTPPSLVRVYKEMESCLPGFKAPKHGYLARWAENGILMINATMTVRAKQSNSHKDCGWQKFTDAVMAILNREKKDVVYFLWGAFAQKKGKVIDEARNIVIKTPHPSPLSQNKWFGNRCFALANERLKERGLEPLDWSVDGEETRDVQVDTKS